MHFPSAGNEMGRYDDLEFPPRHKTPIPWHIRAALVSEKRNYPDTPSAWFSLKERLRTIANQP